MTFQSPSFAASEHLSMRLGISVVGGPRLIHDTSKSGTRAYPPHDLPQKPRHLACKPHLSDIECAI